MVSRLREAALYRRYNGRKANFAEHCHIVALSEAGMSNTRVKLVTALHRAKNEVKGLIVHRSPAEAGVWSGGG